MNPDDLKSAPGDPYLVDWKTRLREMQGRWPANGFEPSTELEARFAKEWADEDSDIHEHLPLLRDLASRCSHVTEFGLRRGSSTTALLAGQPETLISWDIKIGAIVSNHTADLYNARGKTVFEPRVGSTLEVTIEETDLLFIDTLHTSEQLKAELIRHHAKVRKFLVFHDTQTFGQIGEDGKEPGLRAVIRGFQKFATRGVWFLLADLKNNNGLVVLERVNPSRGSRWE